MAALARLWAPMRTLIALGWIMLATAAGMFLFWARA